MKINVDNIGDRYARVEIHHDGHKLDIGMLNARERNALAEELIRSAYNLGPSDIKACNAWFSKMLDHCGIVRVEPEGE